MNIFHKMTGAACCVFAMLAGQAQADPDSNFHIYIAYGQSNMEGNATNFEAIDKKEHPRVKMFATTSCSNLNRPTVGEIYPAVPPMFKCNSGLSVADWFGRDMADSLPDVTIGIIPVAQGGTSIRLFDPDDYKNYIASAADWLQSGVKAYGSDGNAMGRIIEVAKKAQEKGVIKGIIFHQGETDGGMSNWEQVVKKTYEYMLNQLNLKAEDVPFVAGEMVDGGSCAGFSSRVRGLSEYIVNFGVASSSGYGSKGDGLHFTVQGYRGMGERYAQQMLKLINVTPVEPVPQTPFKGEPLAIPGKIEAEDFDIPGVGAGNDSYSDNDTENHGNSDYRKDTGVDLYTKTFGTTVGYTQDGEWLEYTVDVKKAGDYTMFASVASSNGTAGFQISMDGKAVTEKITVPKTVTSEGDFNEYGKVQTDLILAEGKHIMRFTVVGDWMDVDYFTFVEGKGAADPELGENVGNQNCDNSNTESELCEIPGGEDGIFNFHFGVSGAEKYDVYTLKGQFLGKIFAHPQDLQKETARLVKHSEMYLVKSERGLIRKIFVK